MSPPKNANAISPTRAEDFPGWFQAVVKDAEVAELAHVRGSMVIRPWGFAIWELMQAELDRAIKATGSQNAYFPLFIPLSYLEAEAGHVEGFAKEMAVVTHHRLEADPGNPGHLKPGGELAEPLVVRPTSETIIGKSFAKWINSYRDLPLMINQWANVVRWEMRPRVLLRTTEFLWQEGHTAHADEPEAREEMVKMLGVYADFAESFLAMPVIRGEKSAEERFPGAVVTLSIEAMMQDGKALQAGTSHYLGTNFAEASGIEFSDRDGGRGFVHTTSWGVSTRLLGALIMSHSDDDGLRLPPAMAPSQVVIVPILRGDASAEVAEAAEQLAAELRERSFGSGPIRATVDTRDRGPADKRWEWIKKGVPIVIELGPRDLENGELAVRRRTALADKPETVSREAFPVEVETILEEIQLEYFKTAAQRLESRTARDITDLGDFRKWFEGDEGDSTRGGFVRAPWSEAPESLPILEELKASVRCLPLDQELAPGSRCVLTGKPAVVEAVFGKAY